MYLKHKHAITMILGILANIFRTMSELMSAVFRDLLGVYILIKVETKMHLIDKRNLLVGDLFRKLVKMQPNKACVVFNEQVWTFQDVNIKNAYFFDNLKIK